ncbi:rhomboid family intramembrane serine protease [Cesiribacter andamanensis]|uniref:Rhombosortase n=1 Tax=Cesiribacter andamanensis AMV16 TaxID=1279009 RepID=M7N0W3_9BACT|nr:rhomboid family intramembrane serine protease [Cesiribacter andamanensis]EMR00952.1 rhombosortase [Cesiribacter andamanensis AMV16]
MTPEAHKLRNSIFFVFTFTVMLWLIKALEWAVAMDFGFLGILPRTLSGTMGIVTAPLVHGDILHLLSNTFPLLLLGISVFYFYDRIALEVFVWIYFMSGFWVWMAARDAYHIGASGLVYGLVSFLFFSGLFRRDIRSLSISLIVIFLYGGMVQGLFPTNDRISWESHMLGALAGAFCAFFYRDTKLMLSEVEEAENEGVLQPAMIGAFSSEHASRYSEMQERIDTYDALPAVWETPPAIGTALQPINLSYNYQPQARQRKVVSSGAVFGYRLNARHLTDPRYTFAGDPKKAHLKKDIPDPIRTAAA